MYGKVWAEMVETFQAWGEVPRAPPLRDETEVLEERASRFIQSQLSKVTSIPSKWAFKEKHVFFEKEHMKRIEKSLKQITSK